MFCTFAVVILGAGCSRTPKISFYPTWFSSKSLAEMSTYSKSKFSIENIAKGSPGLTMIVHGKLPLGDFEIRAISISEKDRKDASILPPTFTNTDPQANIRGFRIFGLVRPENMSQATFALSTLISGQADTNLDGGDADHSKRNSRVADNIDIAKQIRLIFEPGRYYVFIVKDGKEVAGTELEIAS